MLTDRIGFFLALGLFMNKLFFFDFCYDNFFLHSMLCNRNLRHGQISSRFGLLARNKKLTLTRVVLTPVFSCRINIDPVIIIHGLWQLFCFLFLLSALGNLNRNFKRFMPNNRNPKQHFPHALFLRYVFSGLKYPVDLVFARSYFCQRRPGRFICTWRLLLFWLGLVLKPEPATDSVVLISVKDETLDAGVGAGLLLVGGLSLVQVDWGAASRAFDFLNQPGSKADEVENVAAAQLFALANVAQANAALKLLILFTMDVLEALELVDKLAPLVHGHARLAQPRKIINDFTEKVNGNLVLRHDEGKYAQVQKEVKRVENEVHTIECEFLLKPLLLEVEFKE